MSRPSPKRPASEAGAVRLDKWIADRTVHSRSQTRTLLKRRRVCLNGEVCTHPRTMVQPTDEVTLDGERLTLGPLVWLYHKPIGVVTTTDDPWGRSSLASTVPDQLAQGYHPVGRLDRDTDGLLLLSRHGTLTQRLLHPRREVEKQYRAEVEGMPTDALVEILARGVQTAEGVHRARVDAIEGAWVTLTVTEGKHRMVRRMLHNAGHSVRSLRRLKFGALRLEGLEVGALRAPIEAETAWLHNIISEPGQ